MCKILYQIYACGHGKPICITACPRALATPQPNALGGHQPPNHLHHQILPVKHPSPPFSPTPPTTRRAMSTSVTVNMTAYADLPSYDANTNYCARIFAHNLSPSKHPCLICYLKPEWARMRARWVNEYRITHPGTQNERLNELSGVTQIADAVGLVNVVEISRDMERRLN